MYDFQNNPNHCASQANVTTVVGAFFLDLVVNRFA